MAPQTAGARAHRPSASRVIPAIPHALGSKPRQKVEQAPATSPVDPAHTQPESQESEHFEPGANVEPGAAPQSANARTNGSLTPPTESSRTEGGETQASAAIRNDEEAATGGHKEQDIDNEKAQGPSSKSTTICKPHAGFTYTNIQHVVATADHHRVTDRECNLPPVLGNSHPRIRTPAGGPLGALNPLPNAIATHQTRHSANGLVFGGTRDSANSSPTLNNMSGPGPYPLPPHNYSGPRPGAAPFVPHGHAYHFSEPHVGPSYPPPFMSNANSFDMNREYYTSTPNQAGPPRFYLNPARPHFPPRRQEDHQYQPRHPPPPQYRGPPFGPPIPSQNTSLDMSKTPGAIHPALISTGTPPSSIPYNLPQQSPADSSRFDNQSDYQTFQPSAGLSRRGPRQRPDPNAALALADYLQDQFSNPDFADNHIRLCHSGHLFASTVIPGHGVLLARSPKLRSLMTMEAGATPRQMMPFRVLNLTITDRFLNLEAALSKAIMRLYAEPLPDKATAMEFASPDDQQRGDQQGCMRFALAYAAAGHYLQIDEIVTRGLDLASTFLDWRNVDKALAFALDGGLSISWHQRDGPVEDKDSTSSHDGSQSKLDSPMNAPTYGFDGERLLQRILQFIASNWPTDFKLVATSRQLSELPRLPAIADTTHARSKSHLARIRFGDMTIEEEAVPDPATITFSSVLVSLPFPVLKHILEDEMSGNKLGWQAMAELTRAVVTEREQRRERAAQHKDRVEVSSALEERLWHNVRWIEAVEESQEHPSGLRLVRHRLGAETPASAGSTIS